MLILHGDGGENENAARARPLFYVYHGLVAVGFGDGARAHELDKAMNKYCMILEGDCRRRRDRKIKR